MTPSASPVKPQDNPTERPTLRRHDTRPSAVRGGAPPLGAAARARQAVAAGACCAVLQPCYQTGATVGVTGASLPLHPGYCARASYGRDVLRPPAAFQ